MGPSVALLAVRIKQFIFDIDGVGHIRVSSMIKRAQLSTEGQFTGGVNEGTFSAKENTIFNERVIF